MPRKDGLRLDDDERGTPGAAPDRRQHGPEKPVGRGEFRLLDGTAENAELMAQRQVLQLHHASFISIDLQSQPAFQLRLDPPREPCALKARPHDEVVGLPH